MITYDDVVNELPAIIATRGEDFVYSVHEDSEFPLTCTYVHNGEPDCLIGCYLASKGVPLEAFDHFESSAIDDAYYAGKVPITITQEALTLLARIQMYQDASCTWGNAFYSAIEGN